MATIDLTKVTGVGPATAQILQDNGINDIASLAKTDLEVLVLIPGIGSGTGERMIASAKALAGDGAMETEPPQSVEKPPKDKKNKGKKDKNKKGKKDKKDKKSDKKKGKNKKGKNKKTKKGKNRK